MWRWEEVKLADEKLAQWALTTHPLAPATWMQERCKLLLELRRRHPWRLCCSLGSSWRAGQVAGPSGIIWSHDFWGSVSLKLKDEVFWRKTRRGDDEESYCVEFLTWRKKRAIPGIHVALGIAASDSFQPLNCD